VLAQDSLTDLATSFERSGRRSSGFAEDDEVPDQHRTTAVLRRIRDDTDGLATIVNRRHATNRDVYAAAGTKARSR
jgi:hypothetical protein